MPAFQFLDYLIIGNIQTEYIIDLHNRSHNELLGGSALYAAGGLRCWDERIAVVSQAQVKHRNAIQINNAKYQINFEGVSFFSEPIEDRCFMGYISPYEVVFENPTAFYASRNLTFPKTLIGFEIKEVLNQTKSKTKYLPEDLPLLYRDASTALLCPDSYATQLQLTSILLNTSTRTLVIHSSPQYMHLANYENMSILMKDVNTFITTTSQLADLFRNRTKDLWEMAEIVCSFGCEHLIMYDGKFGYFLFDRRSKSRYQIPIYPNKMIDPTGMQDSFCGGYLSGLKKNFDPVEGIVYGSVSASLTAEGSGPFFCADTMPGLQQSRLRMAREMVKRL